MALALFLALCTASANLTFPTGDREWPRIDPGKAGWDAKALDAALDFAGSRRSSAVVILHRGRIMAERQWAPGPRAEKTQSGRSREDVASLQKSITATLCGIAIEKGLVGLRDPVSKHLGEGWSKATREQESQITIRHLLTMTSGLTDGLEFQAAPGTRWRYNTPAYQKLLPALAKAAGITANELSRQWLFGPIGMADSEWRARPAMPGLVGLFTTAYDLARFGLLIQADGVWSGKRLVPQAWIREMLTPSQKLNPAYGLLWWLNGPARVDAAGRDHGALAPSAPRDLVAALGALGRKVYVVPSLELVITRTGQNSDAAGEAPFDEALWSLVMKAAPR